MLPTQAIFSRNKEFKLGHVSEQIRVTAGCDSCCYCNGLNECTFFVEDLNNLPQSHEMTE